jgi:hypothetical protein
MMHPTAGEAAWLVQCLRPRYNAEPFVAEKMRDHEDPFWQRVAAQFDAENASSTSADAISKIVPTMNNTSDKVPSIFAPLDPEVIQEISPNRLRRCRSVANVRRTHIEQVLHMVEGKLLDDFKQGISAYGELISRIEVEFARRAMEGALNGTR